MIQVPLYVVSGSWARLRPRRLGARGAVGRGRTLAEFQKEFPDEPRCAAFLSARRWPDGFVCPACGRGRAVALKSRPRLLECLDCRRQTSLTAGTAMHRSEIAADDVVLGGACDGDAFQRHVGATIGGTNSASPIRRPGCWRRSFGARWSIPTAIFSKASSRWTRPRSLRAGHAFFEPGTAGKILVAGAVEMIDQQRQRYKPRRNGAKYLLTRSGRLRLAVIADARPNRLKTSCAPM